MTGQLRTAQDDANKAYRILVDKVNAFILIEGDAEYADFVDKINEQVKHYKQEVLPPSKRKNDTKKPAENKNPADDSKKPSKDDKKPAGKKPASGGKSNDEHGTEGKNHGEVEITPKT